MYKIFTQLNSFGNTQISIIKVNENGSFTSFPNDPTNSNYKALFINDGKGNFKNGLQ